MDVQNEMKPYVIGLDLGGTNSVFGIVDSRGDIKVTTAIKTQAYDDVNDYVKAAVEALQIIIDQVGGIGKIKAMGIGAPNGNYYNGTIEFAPNLKWGRTGVVPLAKLFSDALGIPVALTNDANAAAIGEMTYGVARGMKNFIVITLGTGVGSGIVVNGQLVYGCDGFAGELGHVIVKKGKWDMRLKERETQEAITMYIDANTVITAAAVVTALGVLGGVVAWVVKLVQRDRRQSAEIIRMQDELTIICYGLRGALQGLIEQGCNGPCKDALTRLDKHLNLEAHVTKEL